MTLTKFWTQAMLVKMEIESLIAAAQSPGGKIVSCVDSILELLLAENLAYRMLLPPATVGIHPANRDGYGVSATEVRVLGAEIVVMGWSWEAC